MSTRFNHHNDIVLTAIWLGSLWHVDFDFIFQGLVCTTWTLVLQWSTLQQGTRWPSDTERRSCTKNAPKDKFLSVPANGPVTTVILTSDCPNAEVRTALHSTRLDMNSPLSFSFMSGINELLASFSQNDVKCLHHFLEARRFSPEDAQRVKYWETKHWS